MRPGSAAAALALGLSLVAAYGSSAGSTPPAARTSTASQSSFYSPSPSTRPSCPNSEGGACLGRLQPRISYSTTVFSPTITYSVPARGWFNYEDTPGNFLLVPPGNDLTGVNAGTSDFLGVYRAVAAARFTDLPSCSTTPIRRVAQTPRAIVAWMRRQAPLSVTDTSRVSVGGLSGLVTDVRVRPGARLPTCQDGSDQFSVFLLFTGVPPSSLDHGVIRGMTMRLYLLALHEQVLCIELDDIDTAPSNLATLSRVARRLEFRA